MVFQLFIKHLEKCASYDIIIKINWIFGGQLCDILEIIKTRDIIGLEGKAENVFYWGDNFDVMLQMLSESKYKGKIKLVYIDPPFATKGTFKSKNQTHAYSDVLSGGQFIEFLRKRLILLKELLADDGSIYLHLDNNMAFTMKIIMDEVFGEQNFRAFITRRKCSNKNYTKNTYGNVSDYILFYSKSAKYIWNRPLAPWEEQKIIKEYP